MESNWNLTFCLYILHLPDFCGPLAIRFSYEPVSFRFTLKLDANAIIFLFEFYSVIMKSTKKLSSFIIDHASIVSLYYWVSNVLLKHINKTKCHQYRANNEDEPKSQLGISVCVAVFFFNKPISHKSSKRGMAR